MTLAAPSSSGSDTDGSSSDERVLVGTHDPSQATVETTVERKAIPAADDEEELVRVIENAIEQAHPGVEEVMLQLRKRLLIMVMKALLQNASGRNTPFSHDELQRAITQSVRRLFGLGDASTEALG